MQKPTPTQARVLFELNGPEDPEEPALWVEIDKEGHAFQYEASRFSEPISLLTVKTLWNNGWLEPTNPEQFRITREDRMRISSTGIAALAAMSPDDLENHPSSKPYYSTDEILSALIAKYQRYNDREPNRPLKWICFPELADNPTSANSRIDLWVMNTWQSTNFQATAYEIKVYRSDFLKELKEPDKRRFAVSISNYFYFVTPPGLASPDEIPDDCGLMELSPKGKFLVRKQAPYNSHRKQPDWNFLASVARASFTKNNRP